MKNEMVNTEIVKWYNEEKIKIIEKTSTLDSKYQKYQDYYNRLKEIDKILKELL